MGKHLHDAIFRTFSTENIMRCQNGFHDLRVIFYGGLIEIIFGIFCWPEVTGKRCLKRLIEKIKDMKLAVREKKIRVQILCKSADP